MNIIFFALINDQAKKLYTVAGNHKYKEIYGINSVQSALKSHPLWVTLYFKEGVGWMHYAGCVACIF